MQGQGTPQYVVHDLVSGALDVSSVTLINMSVGSLVLLHHAPHIETDRGWGIVNPVVRANSASRGRRDERHVGLTIELPRREYRRPTSTEFSQLAVRSSINSMITAGVRAGLI